MDNFGLRDLPLEKKADEALGLNDYASALTEFIVQCETPLTIALQGDWGSGKTSLMNLITENLNEKNKDIETVFFNTWQYSQFGMTDELTISLLSHFTDKIGAGENTKRILAILRLGLSKTSKFLGSATELFAGEGAGKITEKVLEHLSSQEGDPAKQIEKLKEEIIKSVKNKIEKQNKSRIVVFIDDLDRLLPVKAVELLEAFKLFLDVPGCVYVLACDYQVISQGLIQKFGVGASELKGKSFFDKIIQLPFCMPIGQYNVSEYIKKLLHDIKIEATDKDVSYYSDMIAYSTGFNPRGLKRLFNSQLLLNIVAEKRGLFSERDIASRSEKQRIMFGTLCLQTAYESAYRYMQKNVEKINDSFLNAMKDEKILKDDERFSEIRDGLNDKDGSIMRRFTQFIEYFYQSIQIKSDENENQLSEKEIELLRNILRFSSITSTGGTVSNAEYNYDDRITNREIAKRLIQDLNEKYKNELSQLESKFAVYQGRKTSDVNVYIQVPVDEQYIQIGFWFSNASKDKEGDWIGIYPYGQTDALIKFGKNWFKEKCSGQYPNMKDTNKQEYLKLYEIVFEKETSIKVREDEFRKMVFSNLDILLPLLLESKKKTLR